MINYKQGPATPGRWILALLVLCAVLPACGGSGGGSANPTGGCSNPGSSATNVSTSTSRNNVVTGKEVTATFSEAMDPATLNSSPAGTQLTFTVRETAGNNVPGTVAMNGGGTMATFTPTAAALLANTNYTATVTTGARSAAGITLDAPASWTFTTNAAPSTGQAAVDRGLAGDYAVFANTGIANATAPAALTGHMGVGPGVTSTAITGPWALNLVAGSSFSTSSHVSGRVYAFDYAGPSPPNVTTASNDMGSAYTDAAGRLLPDTLDVAAGNLWWLTITPGLHRW